MLMKVEKRGGYRGGSKPGSYSWSNPGIRYTPEEQAVRHEYLSDFKERIDSYRKIMLEPNCQYAWDDTSFETGLYAISRSAVVRSAQEQRDYTPQYSVRYQEYLKGNNSVS